MKVLRETLVEFAEMRQKIKGFFGIKIDPRSCERGSRSPKAFTD